MANINRGEYDLTVDEVTYTTVLTLNDVEELESTLDIGAQELYARVTAGTARASHIRAVLTRGLLRGRPRLEQKEIVTLLPRVPYPERRLAAMLLLAGALNDLKSQQPITPEEEPVPEATGDKEPEKDPLSFPADGSTGSA